MRVFIINVLVFLLTLLSACANTSNVVKLGDSSSSEERRLLVTFVDRTINRGLPGNAIDDYRIRGNYNNSGWSERTAQTLANRHHIQVVAQWPVTELGVSCVVYEVPDSLSLQEVISEIRKDREVSSVQQMNNFRVLGKQTASNSQVDPYQNLQIGFQTLGIAGLHSFTTGKGIRIALIDTGVDVNHPDLLGQIKYSENLAPEPADGNLAESHGTAVAGVLSARPENGIGIAGIAPDAEVYAMRACWPDKPGAMTAHCNTFSLALALNQAIRLKMRVINLSLSGPEDFLLRQLIEKAQEKGVLVVAAAPDKQQAGGFPANVPGVLAVGRGDESANPEIIAPGQDILTTVPHQAYDFMTGSSFAAPHVTGMAALLLQLHPDLQVAEIKRLLNLNSHLSSNQLTLEMATMISKQDK